MAKSSSIFGTDTGEPKEARQNKGSIEWRKMQPSLLAQIPRLSAAEIQRREDEWRRRKVQEAVAKVAQLTGKKITEAEAALAIGARDYFATKYGRQFEPGSPQYKSALNNFVLAVVR